MGGPPPNSQHPPNGRLAPALRHASKTHIVRDDRSSLEGPWAEFRPWPNRKVAQTGAIIAPCTAIACNSHRLPRLVLLPGLTRPPSAPRPPRRPRQFKHQRSAGHSLPLRQPFQCFPRTMDEQSELRLELKRDFTDFLDQDFGRETGVGRYVKKVDDIIKQYPITKRVRLEVDLQGEGRPGWRRQRGGNSN